MGFTKPPWLPDFRRAKTSNCEDPLCEELRILEPHERDKFFVLLVHRIAHEIERTLWGYLPPPTKTKGVELRCPDCDYECEVPLKSPWPICPHCGRRKCLPLWYSEAKHGRIGVVKDGD